MTTDRELRTWSRRADELNDYRGTIDDYTNDLCSRDALNAIVERCPPNLAERLSSAVHTTDMRFQRPSTPDPEGRIGRFYRITDTDGWRRRRDPQRGPLADYLKEPFGSG